MQIQINQGDAITCLLIEDNSKEAELVQNWWLSIDDDLFQPISLVIISATIGAEAYTVDPQVQNRHCLIATTFNKNCVKELKHLVNSLTD